MERELVRSTIAEIVIDENDSNLNFSELCAFQAAVTDLEQHIERLGEWQNQDQKEAIAALADLRCKHRSQAEEKRNIRLDVIEKQVMKERQQIADDFEEAKAALFKRMICAYRQADLSIQNQLRMIMSNEEFTAYIASHPIEFPQMPQDGQMRTKLQQTDEAKILLSSGESERELARIRQKYKEVIGDNI
jgi:biotin-(acetyl-CoA carboxylase) ligase